MSSKVPSGNGESTERSSGGGEDRKHRSSRNNDEERTSSRRHRSRSRERSSRDDREHRSSNNDRSDRGDRGDRGDRDRSDRDRSDRDRGDRDRSDRGDRDRRRDDYNDRDRDRRPKYDDRDDRRGGDRRDSGRDDYRGGGGGGYRGNGGGGGGGRSSDDRFAGGRNGGGRGGGGGGGKRVFEGFMSPGRRSPSPEDSIPISKRQRKFTAWDVKPPGFENYTAEQAKLTGMFNLPGQSRPTMQPTPNSFSSGENPPLFFRPPGGHNNGGSSGHNNGGGGGNAAILGPGSAIGSFARQSRRLYVGNITMEATDEVITSFFNNKMTEMGMLSKTGLGEDLLGLGLPGDQPVISVHLNYEKNYAFVEFRNAEEATSAMGFDGIIFQNNALKIRRPKDYLGGLGEDGQNAHVPGVVSTNVPDTVNKIFIGGLPSYLSDDQVMELLKSFGELRSFNLVKEGGTGTSKGFAFCEYVDPAITETACQGLNGMELGDRYLVVQRAALGASAVKRETMGLTGTALDFPGSAGVTAPSILAAASGTGGQPTRILQILNMVAIDELLKDEDYEEILEDIKEECGKFGTVVDCKIPRPIKTAGGKVDIKLSDAVKDLGKVFVLFEKSEETTAALQAIAGRQFGGRLCLCAYESEDNIEEIFDI